jgi:hypothetical protein
MRRGMVGGVRSTPSPGPSAEGRKIVSEIGQDRTVVVGQKKCLGGGMIDRDGWLMQGEWTRRRRRRSGMGGSVIERMNIGKELPLC